MLEQTNANYYAYEPDMWTLVSYRKLPVLFLFCVAKPERTFFSPHLCVTPSDVEYKIIDVHMGGNA